MRGRRQAALWRVVGIVLAVQLGAPMGCLYDPLEVPSAAARQTPSRAAHAETRRAASGGATSETLQTIVSVGGRAGVRETSAIEARH